jgi:hypothetical protein
MEDVGIFYGHLVHFTVFCYIFRTFGIVCSNLVYFFPFWYFALKKSGNPALKYEKRTGLAFLITRQSLSDARLSRFQSKWLRGFEKMTPR